MFYYYYDWTYLLVLIGVVICMAASGRVNSVFSRYSRVRSHSGMTGKEAAERILRRNGIYDVQVIHIPGPYPGKPDGPLQSGKEDAGAFRHRI